MNHPLYDEYLTVTDAARLLQISRNDMHRIPVQRWRFGPTECYRKDQVAAWAERDLASSASKLLPLREKKNAVTRKQAKRANPHTKTGKIKKRFRESPPINCPKCGGDLAQEALPPDLKVQHETLVERSNKLDRLVEDEQHPAWNQIEDALIRVNDEIDRLRPLIDSYRLSLIVRCSKCNTVFSKSHMSGDDHEDDWDEPDDWDKDLALLGVRRNRKPLARIDDDVRAMTSSMFSEKSGEYVGEIPDHNQDDDKS